MKTYIFWYWSLINKDSIKKTWEMKWELIPVKLKWFERWFNIDIDLFKITALWVEINKDSYINWVIYEIEWWIDKFDEREIWYSRYEVNLKDIEFYKNENIIDWDYKVYIYIPDEINNNTKYNTTLSYLDVCISWCLNFSEEFCNDFFKTTNIWNIENDRDNPKYPRHLSSDFDYSEINTFYKKYSITNIN